MKVKRHANVSQETLASLSKQKPLKGRAVDIGWLCFANSGVAVALD